MLADVAFLSGDIEACFTNAGSLPEAVGTISLARSIAHGVAQGAMSVLQGGKFKHGFVSGFFGHVGKNLGTALGFGELGTQQGKSARTFIAALVGGTVSERTGGKFANGAMTAAIVHLYNAEESFASYMKERLMSGQVRDDMFSGFAAYFKIASGIIGMGGGWIIKNFNATVGSYTMVDGASTYLSGITDLSNQMYGTSHDADFLGGWFREAATNYGFSPETGNLARAGTSLFAMVGGWVTAVPRVVPGSSWTYTETRLAVTQSTALSAANDLYAAHGALKTLQGSYK